MNASSLVGHSTNKDAYSQRQEDTKSTEFVLTLKDKPSMIRPLNVKPNFTHITLKSQFTSGGFTICTACGTLHPKTLELRNEKEKWKSQRRDPSPRTDRYRCEQIQIMTTFLKHVRKCMYSIWIQEDIERLLVLLSGT